MIDLYTLSMLNSRKVSIILEETGPPCATHQRGSDVPAKQIGIPIP